MLNLSINSPLRLILITATQTGFQGQMCYVCRCIVVERNLVVEPYSGAYSRNVHS